MAFLLADIVVHDLIMRFHDTMGLERLDNWCFG